MAGTLETKLAETAKDVKRLADAWSTAKPIIDDLRAKLAALAPLVDENAALKAEILAAIDQVDAIDVIAETAVPE